MTNLDSFFKQREPLTEISVLQLKRLLVLMSEHVFKVGFRYRLVGHMWQSNFMRVIHVTNKGVLLKDDVNNRFVTIPELDMIIQFELDGSIQALEPNFHYSVFPDLIGNGK